MRHQYDYDIGNMGDDTKVNDENNPAEIRAVYLENIARDLEKLGHRTKYGGQINSQLLKAPPNNKMPRLDSGGQIGPNGQKVNRPKKNEE